MSNKRNVVLYLDNDIVESTRQLGFNLSKTVENHFKQLILQYSAEKNDVECGRRDLNPGRQRGSLTLNWLESKAEFMEYLQSKHFNERYARCMLSYLDKNVSKLHEPMDVVKIFSKLTLGQQHNLIRALRTFLNFAELKGVVTRSQILDFLAKNPNNGRQIGELLIGKEPAMRAYMDEPSKRVLKRMLSNNLTRLPVVNDRNQLQGVISLKNLSKIRS